MPSSLPWRARDTWPALALMALGGCFFASAATGPRADVSLWGLLIGLVATPLGAGATVLAFRHPRRLAVRLLLAVGAGAVTLALLLASLRPSAPAP